MAESYPKETKKTIHYTWMFTNKWLKCLKYPKMMNSQNDSFDVQGPGLAGKGKEEEYHQTEWSGPRCCVCNLSNSISKSPTMRKAFSKQLSNKNGAKNRNTWYTWPKFPDHPVDLKTTLLHTFVHSHLSCMDNKVEERLWASLDCRLEWLCARSVGLDNLFTTAGNSQKSEGNS